jgi:outer membrane protein assembly factor BamB
MRRTLLVLCTVLALAACNRASKKENIEPPAELTEFAATVAVDQVWSRDMGDGEERLGVRQHPALADGRLYAADLEGNVVALQAGTGAELWRVETGLRFTGGPGVAEGTVVVGSLDGDVVALNPDDGAERWRAKVSSEVIATPAPAVGNGLAVVRANDGRVFAFSLTDGERRWIYDRGLPSLTLRGNGPPLIAEGAVFLGYDNGTVVALRAGDGVQQWEQTVAAGEGRTEIDRMVDIDGELIVDSQEVFAAAFNGQVLAIAMQGGRPLWNREVSSYGGLALAGERILASDRDGTVWAFDRRTGAAMWKQEALAHRWLTTPAVQGGYAVVGDLEGYVHWLSLEDGALAARDRLSRDPIRATPQVADDLLYVVSTDGELGAYKLQ